MIFVFKVSSTYGNNKKLYRAPNNRIIHANIYIQLARNVIFIQHQDTGGFFEDIHWGFQKLYSDFSKITSVK